MPDTAFHTGRREQLRSVFEAAVAAVAPETCVRSHLERRGDGLRVGDERWALGSMQRLVVLGAGKACLGMAAAALEQLGELVDSGLLVSNVAGTAGPLEALVGGHPIPSQASVEAGQALVRRISALGEHDRFLFLLSGGASALCELPAPSLTLADLQATTRLLLASGASIVEVNAVRKHLSRIKGGRLGGLTRGAGAVLVLSDVIGDDLSAVGSGPFYPDTTTYAQCLALMDRLSLARAAPRCVMEVLRAGAMGSLPDTPHEPWPRVSHHLVGSNQQALAAAAEQLRRLGLATVVHDDPMRGEARALAPCLMQQVLSGPPVAAPTCHLFGGETTVTVQGYGQGGRNQELALAALLELRGRPDVCLLSAGTDGVDGGSDAAGAFVDCEVWRVASARKLDPALFLDDNDSHTFFAEAGAQLHTGPTGTNVMDILMVVRERG